MTRHALRRASVLLATAALAAVSCGGSVAAPVARDVGARPASATAAQRSARPVRPNVVVITLDDLAETDLAVMPRTRRLMRDEGTTLTEGLAPTPICAPSRASLLTGQYAHHHGVTTIEGAGGGFDAFRDRKTLPTWLRTAGYDTAFIGKYLNGYGVRTPRYVPPGWNHWRGSVDFSTYSFWHTQFNVDGRLVRPPGYNTDILARYTDEVLAEHRRSAARTRPLFLWVNYVAPHHGGRRESDDPRRFWPGGRELITTTPDTRDRNTFRHARLPRDPSIWERDITDNFHALPRPGRAYRRAMVEAHQQRLESVRSVDRAIARTFRTLRRTGELAHTVVMVTSDNGFMVGQHNLFGKLWAYDDSLRVPMLLRGPGVPRGRRVGTPVTVPDLAVTIAGLAGARPTRVVDGVDAWPLLTAPDHRRVVPIEAYPLQGGLTRIYSGIRYGDLTYVHSQGGREELYDRAVDPGELTNVAADPAYAPTLARMRDWDRRYRDCEGTGCPGATAD